MPKVVKFTLAFNVQTKLGEASFVLDDGQVLPCENLSADCIAAMGAVVGSGANITSEPPWITRKEQVD